jgi:amino acid transporter
MPNSSPVQTLKRTITLRGAVSLNMMNMIGVGPFITMPLVVAAMGGPQAITGWILGALIALCDGLVWAELGAALPRAGGSYAFLREIYARPSTLGRTSQNTRQEVGASEVFPSHSGELQATALPFLDEGQRQGNLGLISQTGKLQSRAGGLDLGRYLSFLYIWQLSFTAPLSIASGCIGLAQYASYLWPALGRPVCAAGWAPRLTSFLAAAVCALVVLLLYRGVSAVTRVASVLTVGVLATLGAIILAGFTHFHPSLLHMPAHAFAPTHGFFEGLGLATLIATYDYWGYYNVCFLGGEIRDPGRTIPRAVLLSIAIVAALYLAMQVAILGVIPWRDMVPHAGSHSPVIAVGAMLMDRTWGHTAAVILSLMIMWTAFASVAALLLGYSRAPYAAAVDGNYFRSFARLHPRHGFPYISLLALGAAAMFFCFFNLAQVIAALVAVRIVLQYILQQIGVMVLRWRQPALERPFRMWLYPLPPIIALTGFLFLLVSRKGAGRELLFAAAVAVSGSALFFFREQATRHKARAGHQV